MLIVLIQNAFNVLMLMSALIAIGIMDPMVLESVLTVRVLDAYVALLILTLACIVDTNMGCPALSV